MRAARQRLAHIDGLRAVAILGVVGYHVGLPGFRGGFVGVDVFFVISGFLITGLIVDRLDAGTFTYRQFYAERVLRIFPPLLLVICVTLLAAALLKLSPFALANFGETAAASAAIYSNFRDQSHLSDLGSLRLFRSFPDEVAWTLGNDFSGTEPR
jgi:peptidoglycan/LPS O-acetylase OafA/YrhL